jgi:FkbM family methyltransferase
LEQIKVLDIGARGGARTIFPNFLDRSSYDYYLERKVFDIIGIEPDKEERQKLIDSGYYTDIYTCALSDIDGKCDLYITKSKDCSSLLRPNYDIIRNVIDQDLWGNFEVIEKKKVITKTLSTFCNENNITSFDLIKIDVQGLEYEIVEGGLKIIQNSLAVVAELSKIPWYINQKPYKDFKKKMNKQGFKVAKKNIKPHILTESDYLFIKKSNQINGREELIKVLVLLLIFNNKFLFCIYTIKGFFKTHLNYLDLKEIFIIKKRKFFID